MKEIYKFTDEERYEIEKVLENASKISPYINEKLFNEKIQNIIDEELLPKFFLNVCEKIKKERNLNKRMHVLKNCPIEYNIPDLNLDDPINDKYKKKTSFLSESFLAVFNKMLGTPLFSYASRNNGDFFTDVIAIKKFKGKKTGFTDGDLIYHNDRTSHPIRADYITLLGIKCPEEDLVYTNVIYASEIIRYLSEEDLKILSQKQFYTEVDDLTKNSVKNWNVSKIHEVIFDGKIRFQETLTKPVDINNKDAYKALLNLRDAMTKSVKHRHRLEKRDLLTLPNQYALHNRECIEVKNPNVTSERWLLKTYSFESESVTKEYSEFWTNGVPGRVNDGL
ncbi:TPA: hypothetical protein PP906_000062 [Staphylococcus aureus]|nr:hypothetical protein [Staphylococcus aureus]HDJ3212831.1 hypothetical protein [Staphylococcus aureus]